MTTFDRDSNNANPWLARLDPSPKRVSDGGVKSEFLVELDSFHDSRGSLTVLQSHPSLPKIERIFVVYGSALTSIRGDHAHHTCTQILVSTSGWTDVYLETPKREFICIRLDDPRFGILIPPRHWGSQYQRSNGAVLTVVASHLYDSADYIRSYADWEAQI